MWCVCLTGTPWLECMLHECKDIVLFPKISFFPFFKNVYCNSITVVCIFSPSLHPTPAEPTSLPQLHPAPWFCPWVLFSNSWKPLSSLSPPHSPLASVRLFLTSVSLVIFCLLFSFVDYVPVKGEIIWYLSLTACLISLSIMLSSSIQENSNNNLKRSMCPYTHCSITGKHQDREAT